MKKLKSTKSRVIQSLVVLIVLTGLIPTLGIFSVGRQSAKASGITEYNIGPTNGSDPFDITSGPDGNLWFTEFYGNKIGQITPSGTITVYAVPTNYSQPSGITSGPDGNLWFTEFYGNKIGQITPSGTITEYTVPTDGSKPLGITSGPDGNLWFTEFYGGKIGRITPSGTITEYTVPTSYFGPSGITSGPDGNLWFTEAGGKIGRITPSGTITEYPVPTASSGPKGITAGPDGDLWFTEWDGYKIGQITPGGTITEYAVPTNGSRLNGITSGPDGNLWFTEWNGNNIGQITPSGTITEYAVPTNDQEPWGITSGPDGNLWFTERLGNKIDVLYLSGVTPSPTFSPTTVSDNVYVALGDSYSSGEGIEPFFEPGDIESCHRSTLAYPTLVKTTDPENYGKTYYSLRSTAGYGWGFNACSGDTSTVIDNTQLINNANDINTNFLPLNSNTKLVTLTAGGDDLGFGDVLKFCALNTSDNCANDKYQDGKTLAQWATEQMSQLGPNLKKLYTDIRNDAPNAKILVLGYPQLFPASKAEQDCLQLKQRHFHIRLIGTNRQFNLTLGYSNQEQNFFRDKDVELNSAINTAVNNSGLSNIEFVPVQYLGADGFAGHEVCGNKGAWINGPSVEYIAGQVHLDPSKDLKAYDYSFHPKQVGQAEYANIINTLLQGNL